MSKEDFYSLTPDQVLEAVETAGFRTTGEFLQLNSYENRVFDLRLEPASEPHEPGPDRLITKFYRPGRWTKQAILEEHDILNDLALAGQPVVAPIALKNASTVMQVDGMWMSCFSKARGRLVQEFMPGDLQRVGRTLARMHNVGEQKKFQHRLTLSTESILQPALEASEPFRALEVNHRYVHAAATIEDFLMERLNPAKFIRIHGDCHKGNLLEYDRAGQPKEFFFLDFDDSLMGPEVQDFWMLLSGDDEAADAELDELLSGYLELRNLDEEDLDLIPALRGLRIIHYAGWIARRWEDPSFPKLFPQFHDYNYWAEETEALERIANICASS